MYRLWTSSCGSALLKWAAIHGLREPKTIMRRDQVRPTLQPVTGLKMGAAFYVSSTTTVDLGVWKKWCVCVKVWQSEGSRVLGRESRISHSIPSSPPSRMSLLR